MAADQQRAMIVAHVANTRSLREELLDLIRALFGEFTSWHGRDADEFAEQAAPIVAGAQRDMADLTTAYLNAMVSDQTGRTVDVPTPGLDEDLRGVPSEEVYRRPFTQLWSDLADGKPLDGAVEAAERRAVNLASTDLELAQTHTTRAVLAEMAALGGEDPDDGDDDGVVGYRRVLTGAENCGLCVVASTQRYHVRDLMPIHPGCDCCVAPIVGDMDPGQVINSVMVTEGAEAAGTTRSGVPVYRGDDLIDLGDLLEPIHDAVEATFGRSDRGGRDIDYRKVMTVYEHGELGPVLKVKDHTTADPDTTGTGPAPVPDGSSPEPGGPPGPPAPAPQPAGPTLDDLIPGDRWDSDDEDRARAALVDRLDGEYGQFEVNLTRIEMYGNAITADFDIRVGGQDVGMCERTFARDRDGTLYAEHDYLSLLPDYEGQGFASMWNAQLADWYRESGFDHIRVHANIDVGGYAWARAGFDFESEDDANNVIARFRDTMTRYAKALDNATTQQEIDGLTYQIDAGLELLGRLDTVQWGDDDFPTAFEFAQCGRTPLHVRRESGWFGKRAMLGSDWNGRKPL